MNVKVIIIFLDGNTNNNYRDDELVILQTLPEDLLNMGHYTTFDI